MAKNSILKTGKRRTDYHGLLKRGNQVKVFLTANVGLYPTPNPTLVQLQAHLTALTNAIAAWGTPHNRGSRTDKVALNVAAQDVYNDIEQLAAYVVNTVDNTLSDNVQLAKLLDSGFPVKSVPAKIGIIGPVQNLKIVTKKNVLEPNIYMRWKKPLQLITGSKLTGYTLYKNGVFLRAQTGTSLIVTRPTGATPDIYVIKPMGDFGEGEACTITVHSM